MLFLRICLLLSFVFAAVLMFAALAFSLYHFARKPMKS